MHKPSVSQLVYKYLFPRPRPNQDPTSFAAHITRNLVPEVRVETANFYGALDCIEAQYPGLDYTYEPHRKRLSRFPWHRKLFRAFNDLVLTNSEILSLCQWEGTKSAKDKYERDAGKQIRDTTMDGIAPADIRRKPVAYFHLEDDAADASDEALSAVSEEVRGSYGRQLNEQLRAAADAQARGERVVFDEQWEQWLKDAMERNDMGVDAMLDAIREGRSFLGTSDNAQASTRASTPSTSMELESATAAARPASRVESRLTDAQEAIVNLRQLEARIDELTTAAVASAAADPPAAEAR